MTPAPTVIVQDTADNGGRRRPPTQGPPARAQIRPRHGLRGMYSHYYRSRIIAGSTSIRRDRRGPASPRRSSHRTSIPPRRQPDGAIRPLHRVDAPVVLLCSPGRQPPLLARRSARTFARSFAHGSASRLLSEDPARPRRLMIGPSGHVTRALGESPTPRARPTAKRYRPPSEPGRLSPAGARPDAATSTGQRPLRPAPRTTPARPSRRWMSLGTAPFEPARAADRGSSAAATASIRAAWFHPRSPAGALIRAIGPGQARGRCIGARRGSGT